MRVSRYRYGVSDIILTKGVSSRVKIQVSKTYIRLVSLLFPQPTIYNKYMKVFCPTSSIFIILFFILGSVEQAFALQTHGGPEGLYAHQLAHLLFIICMGIFAYRIHRTNQATEASGMELFCPWGHPADGMEHMGLHWALYHTSYL